MQPGKLKTSATDPQQVVFPLGNPEPYIMRDTIKMPSIALPLRFLSPQEYAAFENLRALGTVLLLQAPQELGQWYVVLGNAKEDVVTLQTMRQWSTQGILLRDVTVTAQTVAAP